MKAMIEVKDLSPAQVSHVARNVPVTGRTFVPGVPRVCVMFELDEGVELHTEMDVVELAGLTVTLAAIGQKAVAEAALIETAGGKLVHIPSRTDTSRCGDVLGDGTCLVHDQHISACDHGSPHPADA